MKKISKEIKYTDKYFNTLEEYLDEKCHIDQKNDCLIFFNLGEDAKEFLIPAFQKYAVNTVTAYKFIKDLETRFNININVFDLEYIFKYHKERNKNSVIKITDLTQTYIELTNAYRKSITEYLNNVN